MASSHDDLPMIAASVLGVTAPCVDAARRHLEAAGYKVQDFLGTQAGGRAMEAMIAAGVIAGVLDITTSELADELVGGTLSAGRDRLTAAAMRGVPQLISVGALDGRRFHQDDGTLTLMRTTPEENDRLGKEIAEKASAARGPTTILLPLKGVSAMDREGGPFWSPEADAALFQSIRNWVGPWVRLIEVDLHINDAGFARVAAETMLSLMVHFAG